VNKHYDLYLVRKYEPLYRNRYGDMNSTSMCWGFEVGNGWFNIIDTLSGLLCTHWLNAKEEYEFLKSREGSPRYDGVVDVYNKIITPEMVDEAGLKMQEQYEKVPIASQVKEKFGSLRFYVDNARNEHYDYIEFAERLSFHTCEVCGKPGKASKHGWITVRCKEHR